MYQQEKNARNRALVVDAELLIRAVSAALLLQLSTHLYAAVGIEQIPHVQQRPDFCGEACAASWLQKLGTDATQNDVFDASGLDPGLSRGCYTKELAQAIRNLGLHPGPVWYRVSVAKKDRELSLAWGSLLTDLQAGHASIVCMRTGNRSTATEHFRLIVGYDQASDEVFYHEPAEKNGAYRRMALTTFLDLWPLKYSSKEWTLVRFSLRSDENPELIQRKLNRLRSADSQYHRGANYAQHIMQLRKSLPRNVFTIVIEKPFVVIGDEKPEIVKRRAKQTVQWATQRLKREYFPKDPDKILNIWLFKDKQSYETSAFRLFESKPTTPYGYYSPADGALVMNIATGGGTLVHEIVHPFVEANFPSCPSWFNEGLGSLYEQSSSRDGRIIGLTNWRLAGLQRAIRQAQVPSFAELCGTTTKEFYDDPSGTNYAQARYLCYFLQEKGLLHKYYHDFVANQKRDPTGYLTLQRTLQTRDMARFKRDWEQYVMRLEYR